MAEYILLSVQERLQLLQNGLRNAETQRLQAELNLAVDQQKLGHAKGGERNEIAGRLATTRRLIADLIATAQVVQDQIVNLSAALPAEDAPPNEQEEQNE